MCTLVANIDLEDQSETGSNLWSNSDSDVFSMLLADNKKSSGLSEDESSGSEGETESVIEVD